MIDWAEYLKLMVALVAIIDVPGTVPVFLQQTHAMTVVEKRVTAISAGVATAAVLLVFAFVGDLVLEAFGITIESFKILGGLVILIIALDMLGFLGGAAGSFADGESNHPVALGVFPMAVPLFAGPGAISTVMVYAHRDFHSNHDLIVALLIVTVSVLIIVGLMTAVALTRLIGPVAQRVINRLLGMIVGALGIEFIVEGVLASIPA